MRTDRELLEDALFMIESWCRGGTVHDIAGKIRARLAEPEDEPVAWSSIDGYVYRSYIVAKHSSNGREPLPLYRHPRHPVQLSDEEIENLFEENPIGKYPRMAIARAIEKAVLEKNKCTN